MAIPIRMNPVDITIKQLDVAKSNARRDPDFDEMIHGQEKIYSTTISVRGQVCYQTKDEQEAALTGDPGNTDGHLTFRASDLARDGITLRKGDIIVDIAGFPTNYKIVEVRPQGHLRGRANLIMTFFVNNEETNPSIRR